MNLLKKKQDGCLLWSMSIVIIINVGWLHTHIQNFLLPFIVVVCVFMIFFPNNFLQFDEHTMILTIGDDDDDDDDDDNWSERN